MSAWSRGRRRRPRGCYASAQAQHEPEPEPEPEPDPEPSAEYPNRPAGMTLIGQNVGTVKSSNGHAFGIADFGNWFDHNVASHIEVVSDATNPTGSGQSLRFTYPTDDGACGTAAADTFAGGPYTELYIMFRFYLEPGGWTGFGNKFFYWGAAEGGRVNSGSPTQFYNDRPGGAGFRILNQNTGGSPVIDADENPPIGNNSNPIVTGEWLNIEQYCVAESTPGAGDGEMHVWINDTPIGSVTNENWLPSGATANGFDGMEWYAEVNTVPVESYYRLGELYIAGRK